jgi:hypothetical protein
MKRKTLAEQLQEALNSAEYQKGRADAVLTNYNGEKERNNRLEMEVRGSRDEHANLARTLLEIIRWHTNPRTTDYPFKSEKSQREEGRYGSFPY